MMPRAGRLTSTAEFRRAYAHGRRIDAGDIVAHILSTGRRRPARIGVAASKTVGGAVRRNLAKRRLREAVRAVDMPRGEGVDAVFAATPTTARADFQNLVDKVRSALSEAGVFCA